MESEEQREQSPRNMDVWSWGRSFLLGLCSFVFQSGIFHLSSRKRPGPRGAPECFGKACFKHTLTRADFSAAWKSRGTHRAEARGLAPHWHLGLDVERLYRAERFLGKMERAL